MNIIKIISKREFLIIIVLGVVFKNIFLSWMEFQFFKIQLENPVL